MEGLFPYAHVCLRKGMGKMNGHKDLSYIMGESCTFLAMWLMVLIPEAFILIFFLQGTQTTQEMSRINFVTHLPEASCPYHTVLEALRHLLHECLAKANLHIRVRRSSTPREVPHSCLRHCGKLTLKHVSV